MGRVKAFYAELSGQHDRGADEPQPEVVRKMFLLLCNGQPLALYDHRDTAEYEMHICIQGDRYEGIESKYRIKTMGVVTHAYEEETE
jgi:hypothetical protein